MVCRTNFPCCHSIIALSALVLAGDGSTWIRSRQRLGRSPSVSTSKSQATESLAESSNGRGLGKHVGKPERS